MIDELTVGEVRQRVDEAMKRLVSERILTAEQIHPAYGHFWKSLDAVMFAGGKRIRPYLTAVGYGSVDDKILPVAVAQELIHMAMLVHDDIIDKDDFRHGMKNMSGLYGERYRGYVDAQGSTHFAHSAALLAGDALIAEAYQVISDSTFNDIAKRRVTRRLTASVFEVIGGELLDVEAGFMPADVYDPITIYRYKTASYSFIGPLLSGAYCRDASDEECDVLEAIAIHLGVAFQIQDDLLGVFGNQEITGKPTTTDLHEGKRTVLVAFHEARMNASQRRAFNFFADPEASCDQLEQIKQDMIDSGAHQATVEFMEKYFEKAATLIDRVTHASTRVALGALSAQLRQREQ